MTCELHRKEPPPGCSWNEYTEAALALLNRYPEASHRPLTGRRCSGCPLYPAVLARERRHAYYWLGLTQGNLVCGWPDNAWNLSTFAHEIGHAEANRRKEREVWGIARDLLKELGIPWSPDMESNESSACGYNV